MYKSNVYLLSELSFHNVFLLRKLRCSSSNVNLTSALNLNPSTHRSHRSHCSHWPHIGPHDVSIPVSPIGGVAVAHGSRSRLITGVHIHYVFMAESFKFVVPDVLSLPVGFQFTQLPVYLVIWNAVEKISF